MKGYDMDTLRVQSPSLVQLSINGDENRVIEFDPEDVFFAERFYVVFSDFESQYEKMKGKAREIDARNADPTGVPVDFGEAVTLMRESCEYMSGRIDFLFGAGTSKTVFGDRLTLEVISQFLEGVMPYVQKSRSKKVEKYTNLEGSHTLR